MNSNITGYRIRANIYFILSASLLVRGNCGFCDLSLHKANSSKTALKPKLYVEV